jgi:Fe-S-cluster containining protein
VAEPAAPTGRCSACGDCCDPVWYPLGAADIRQSASTTGAADLIFAAAHWRPTGARQDGLHAYQCDRFDAESRLCTAHDERPPICRAYPIPLNILPARCTVR